MEGQIGRLPERWTKGDAYEPYVGRWSRRVAREFVRWLSVEPRKRWLDVGCGTGALTGEVLALAEPASVQGVDPSEGFLGYARRHVDDPRVTFGTGSAMSLPAPDLTFDAVVSGLVLNFVPDASVAAAEMARVTDAGGVVGAYVWDYPGGMQLIRFFWDAVAVLDPAAKALDEGARFEICRPEPLRALFIGAGLVDVEVHSIDVPTTFRDFDDYWMPFLGGQGPAPSYAMSLPEERRVVLRDHIRSTLPIAPDGSIELTARAWAIRGRRQA